MVKHSVEHSERVGQQRLDSYLDALASALGHADREEPFAPKFQANGDLTWTKGPLTLNYGINWFSKTRRFARQTEENEPDFVAPDQPRR